MKTQIGRSIATLSATNIFLIALASPAGAGSDYSRIDRRCITGIDSNVAIDLPTAAQIQEMPVGTPIAQVTALAGTKAYCQTAEKTAPGGTWAQPFVLPIVVQTIAAPPEVLIVYVAQGQLAGVERWNVAPPDWLDRQYDSLVEQNIRSTWGSVSNSWQNRDLKTPSQPIESARSPEPQTGCPPCPSQEL
jgi:hypothetical protein